MKTGDVALIPMPQANGEEKPRPVVILSKMPGFGDWLVCGISSQLHQEIPGFDEKITPSDRDFSTSKLSKPSIIRLGFLALIPNKSSSLKAVGAITPDRHSRLIAKLAEHIRTSKFGLA